MFPARQLISVIVFSTFLTVASAQPRAGCSRIGTVLENDTCDILSARDGVSTYAALL